MTRAPAAALALALLLAALPGLGAPGAPATGPAPAATGIIAVIDTGIDGAHPEFGGYAGQAGVHDPQIVAWWDFGLSGNPAPGQLWDPARPVPVDGVGHGTGTASLAAGLTLGRCPGAKLAVAKVSGSTGALTGDIGAAIQWAVKTVRADVVSMSFGSPVPAPARFDDLDERMAEARELGVLPVASAGNGVQNSGVKYPSETQSPAYSPHVVSVGAATQTGGTAGVALGGFYTNLDPEVTAWGTGVRLAAPGGGYGSGSGTSFSAPKVAGYAACLMGEARAHGRDASPDRIELLLKTTARDDSALPYAIEGYGFVDDSTHTFALALARSGQEAPAPPLQNLLADMASDAAKRAWTESAEPHLALVHVPNGTAGLMGPSLPAGPSQGELYRVPLAGGDDLDLRLRYVQALPAPQAVNDLDLYLFRPGAGDDGVFSLNEVWADSLHQAAAESVERIRFVAGVPGDYVLLVHGYAVAREQPFELALDVDGAPAPAAFLGDVLVAGFF